MACPFSLQGITKKKNRQGSIAFHSIVDRPIPSVHSFMPSASLPPSLPSLPPSSLLPACMHACNFIPIISFIRSFIHSFIHPCIHPCIHPSIHSFIHSIIHLFSLLFFHFVHLFFYSFPRCFIRSFFFQPIFYPSVMHVFILFIHSFISSTDLLCRVICTRTFVDLWFRYHFRCPIHPSPVRSCTSQILRCPCPRLSCRSLDLWFPAWPGTTAPS